MTAKSARLSGGKDFDTVYNEGKSWANRLMVIRARPNGLGSNRYGFAAGRRLGGAVARNRLRRRFREVVRRIPIREGWDIIFIARQAAVDADFSSLLEAARELLARAQLLGNGRGQV